MSDTDTPIDLPVESAFASQETTYRDLSKQLLHKRAMFLKVCQVISALGFGFHAVNWYRSDIMMASALCLSVTVVCSVLLFYRQLRISYTLAAHTSLAVVVLGNYFISIGSWHFTSSTLSVMVLVPVAAMLFFDKRAALVWTIIAAGLIATISFAVDWMTQFISWPTPAVTTFFAQSRLLVVLAGVFVIVFFIDKWANDLLRQLVTQKQDLLLTQSRLLRTQQFKNHFFSSVSHEIRTPMTAVRGISELLLLNKHLDAEDANLVKVLHDSSSHLLTVVNDLLDLSKLEEDKLKIQASPTDIRDAVYVAYSIVRQLAQEKGLHLRLDIDPNLPACVILDSQRLRQILVNLLNNAIKFTHTGYIDLRVNMRLMGQSKVIHFAVEDTGPGIPADKQALIFQSYEQIEDTQSQQVMGTGLGLTICKKLIELQEGHIGVHSELGKGSIFYFHLPLIECSAQECTQMVKKETPSAREQQVDLPLPAPHFRIMLVEDNAVNTLVAKKLLQKYLEQPQIVHAADGAKALAYLEECVAKEQALPQIILMDMHMPVMDGIEATQRIRKHGDARIAKLPIVAMTANAFEDEIKKCLQAGMDDYVHKPFETQTLLEKIKLWAH